MSATRVVRRPAALLVAALASLSLAPAAGAGASHQGPAVSVIVRATAGQLGAVSREVRRLGGSVERELGIIDAATVRLPGSWVDLLRSQPGVRSVTPNSAVTLEDSSYDASTDVNSLYTIEQQVGVRSAWANGITGAGVDVALLDSGVAPVAGLNSPGKVLYGPDLTPESQNDATRNLDTFGHGTHLAGIIAGHDAGYSARFSVNNPAPFLGVAPDARLVSVKVADAQGSTDVSQVIAGIDWVVQHAHDPGMNIRVLNLSFGTNSSQSYLLDPLAYAAEVAWRKGIVVVVSAGNSGAANGRLTDPAIDPFVLAVGAVDRNGTTALTDDTIPAFSSLGDGTRNPDVVAPGAHIASLRVPGSFIDQQFGSTGAISDRYFRGSGTSQAAAFLSGAIALLEQQRPTITPDQVKALADSTATYLPAADGRAQGHGQINILRAGGTWTPSLLASVQPFAASTGLGSLDAARGSAQLADGGVPLSGEQDIMGAPFDAAALAAAELAGNAWAGGTWNGNAWAGNAWAGNAWAGNAWAGSDWAGNAWASSVWAGNAWAGAGWSGNAWAANSWAGNAWAGNAWAGNAWAGNAWAGNAWS